jgi:hypothetical protein
MVRKTSAPISGRKVGSSWTVPKLPKEVTQPEDNGKGHKLSRVMMTKDVTNYYWGLREYVDG